MCDRPGVGPVPRSTPVNGHRSNKHSKVIQYSKMTSLNGQDNVQNTNNGYMLQIGGSR